MVEISTSMLGAKEDTIIDTIYDLEKAKTDYFHIDVMDGKFVEQNTNNQMLKTCEYLNSISTVPLDVHLMTKDIKNYIDSYSIFYPKIITFHYEVCKEKKEIIDIIKYINSKGIKVGISIKPNTSIEEIYEFLPYIYLILVMTVEPGKGGQILIQDTLSKIAKLKKYIKENNLETYIEADGGINPENSKEVINAGAEILVAGSAILNSKDYAKTIKKLRN